MIIKRVGPFAIKENFITFILDCERYGKKITFYFGKKQKTLTNYVLHRDKLYYRTTPQTWGAYNLDDITKIKVY